MGGRAVTRFSRAATEAVLGAACERVRLNPSGAELLRLGENAIYRLRARPVVVRIARNPDHWPAAVKEVAVVGWLDEHHVSAARRWPVEQPIDVDGHPVTFWHYIDGRRGGPGDVRALGAGLRPSGLGGLRPAGVADDRGCLARRAAVPRVVGGLGLWTAARAVHSPTNRLAAMGLGDGTLGP